jgi:archaemetzincin
MTGGLVTGKEHLILIVPLGPVDAGTLTALGSALRDVFRLPVKRGRMLQIPPEAYNDERRQYNSSVILDMLKPLRSPDVCRILAVIDADLYVPRLNFVFGMADMESGVAIISLVRLRNEIYGYPPDNRLLFERTVKEAVHELGHTFGRGHCTDSRCVMYFSNSLEDTDRKGPSFCPNCRGRSGTL